MGKYQIVSLTGDESSCMVCENHLLFLAKVNSSDYCETNKSMLLRMPLKVFFCPLDLLMCNFINFRTSFLIKIAVFSEICI